MTSYKIPLIALTVAVLGLAAYFFASEGIGSIGGELARAKAQEMILEKDGGAPLKINVLRKEEYTSNREIILHSGYYLSVAFQDELNKLEEEGFIKIKQNRHQR